MPRRPLRIATTQQLEAPARQAGYDVYLLPELPSLDFNRTIEQRLEDGLIYRPFLEKHDIELVIDFNTTAMTLLKDEENPTEIALTTAVLGIPYAPLYLDPVTSTMAQVSWPDHWALLESDSWIKCIWDRAHAQELISLGIPNVIHLPIAVTCDGFENLPEPKLLESPVVAFMGHPASSWFRQGAPVSPQDLFAGLTAAAVRSDMDDVSFYDIYHSMYEFGEPPLPTDDAATRAQKSTDYFQQKFTYNAYLAVKQRERFVLFLKRKLGDAFEIIGDHWEELYGLKHTPRIWDKQILYRRMRDVPICLNLIKGNAETSPNLRHFETTACGAFMLSYPMPDLGKFFELDRECVVFHNEHELLEKIQYYVAHPKERLEIALAGQRRTLSKHLYKHRIQQLVMALRDSNILTRETGQAEVTPEKQLPISAVNPVAEQTPKQSPEPLTTHLEQLGN